jgi:uroporphyrinogen decarboxylase
MNSYQRTMNTLTGQPVDRLPVFAVLGAFGANFTGADLRTLYSDADAYVAGQQALQKELGFDLVMSAFDYSAIGEAFGGQVAWFDHQTPNLKRPAVRTASDALKIPCPDVHSAGRLPVILEATRRLAVLYKQQVPIVAVLPGPCILPSLVVGIEPWIEAILFDRNLAQKLLEYTAPFFIAWASALLQAGADCLVFTEGMAAAEVAPRAIFADQCLPHLQSVLAQTPGAKVFHHNGGSIRHILDLIPGLAGVVGVTVGSKDDLCEARQMLGPEITLIGNLDNLTLPGATVEEVTAMSFTALRKAGTSGRFILCNSAADIPQTTPPRNLKAMLAASAEFSAEIGCGR